MKNIRKLIATLLCCLIQFSCLAQEKSLTRIDSIKGILKAGVPDSVKLNQLLKIAKEFQVVSQDSAMYYSAVSYNLSRILPGIENRFNASALLGQCYVVKQAYDKALELAFENLEMAAAAPDRHLMIEGLKNISLLYSDQLHNSRKGIEYAVSALKLAREGGDKKEIIGSLQLVGGACFSADKYNDALFFGKQVYMIAQELNDTALIIQSLVSLGDACRPLKQFDDALQYYHKAIILLKVQQNQTDLTMLYFCIAGVNFEQGNFKESINDFLIAIKRSEDEKWNRKPVFFYREIARAYYETGNYPLALKYNQIAINSEEAKGGSSDLKDLYIINVIIYEKSKNYEMAYRNLTKYMSSISMYENEGPANRISELEVALESAEKQKEIDRMSKEKDSQKIIRNAFIFGFVLLIILVFVLINRSKLKRQVEMERMRSRLSRDLHDDIGSTLSSINILSRTARGNLHQTGDEKTAQSLEKINERSQRLLDNMSDIIWNINPGNDTLEEVMSRMREYAATILEAKNIDYNFNFPKEKLDCRLSMGVKNNLYLIFKEAVNNLSKYSEATNVILSLSFDEKHLHLKILDNGNGFNQNEIRHRGGLINMQHRAEEIKGVIVINSEIGKGTSVELTMPRYF